MRSLAAICSSPCSGPMTSPAWKKQNTWMFGQMTANLVTASLVSSTCSRAPARVDVTAELLFCNRKAMNLCAYRNYFSSSRKQHFRSILQRYDIQNVQASPECSVFLQTWEDRKLDVFIDFLSKLLTLLTTKLFCQITIFSIMLELSVDQQLLE